MTEVVKAATKQLEPEDSFKILVVDKPLRDPKRLIYGANAR